MVVQYNNRHHKLNKYSKHCRKKSQRDTMGKITEIKVGKETQLTM